MIASEVNAALAAMRRGDLDMADAIARRLLDNYPSDPAAHQLFGEVALRRGEGAQAMRSAIESLARRPDHVPALLLAGRAARANEDPAGAVSYFRRATILAPDRADAAFYICAALLELGDPDASVSLTRLLEHFPDDASGWSMLGDALQRAGKPEAALAAFTRAGRSNPSMALELRRGALLESLGQTLAALEAYRVAVQLAPESSEAALKLGLCLRRTGDVGGARKAIEQAARLGAGSSDACFALGLVRQDQREHAAAAEAYRRALDIRPDLAEAAVNLGMCYQEMGNLAAAKAIYRQALGLRPDAFGRIAQALATAPVGEVWLDISALRRSLAGG